MKYSLSNPQDAMRAIDYLTSLIEKKALVEITKVSGRRSLNQNSYLHLLLGAFGQHFGYTMEEAKDIYKSLTPEIYTYEKNGRLFLKSSRDLTKEEMTITIERFRDYSADQEYPLPAATDQGWLMEIENAIEQNKRYL